MDFANETPVPAEMLVGSTGDREMLCIVACKVTYRVDVDGGLAPVTGDDAWPVFEEPFVFRGVDLAPDMDFRKRGIDLLVFGNAIAPRRDAVPSLRLAIECGDFRHDVDVFGERRWRASGRGLVPSSPEPFVEMPLTNDHAYGGAAVWEGTEMTHPVNPDGKGFYLSEEEAEGEPLPNLERPSDRIGAWSDQPSPACLFPPQGVEIDPEEVEAEGPERVVAAQMGTMFNQAVPELIVDSESWGERLRLTGFTPEGELVLPVPEVGGPTAHAAIGDLRSRFPSRLASLIVLVPERVLVATYRCLFRYLFRSEELRSVELRWEGDPAVEPVGTAAGGRRV